MAVPVVFEPCTTTAVTARTSVLANGAPLPRCRARKRSALPSAARASAAATSEKDDIGVSTVASHIESTSSSASERSAPRDAADDARFYLVDPRAAPVDLELPAGDEASGSDSSDDERPPRAISAAERMVMARADAARARDARTFRDGAAHEA